MRRLKVRQPANGTCQGWSPLRGLGFVPKKYQPHGWTKYNNIKGDFKIATVLSSVINYKNQPQRAMAGTHTKKGRLIGPAKISYYKKFIETDHVQNSSNSLKKS